MDKSALINKILSEVKDEKLRDKLLAEVTSNPSNNHPNTDNLISIIENAGIDVNQAAAVIGSQAKIYTYISIVLSALFVIGGIAFYISSHSYFPLIFSAVGLIICVSQLSMIKIYKKQ